MSKNTVKTADNSRVFFNRELSWIEFNARVLAEACNQDVPLFERIKFLSIVSSNFDEFFMVRVAGLKHQARQDPERTDISGLTAKQQTDKIAKRAKELFSSQHRLFKNEILPLLKQEGISYVSPEEFTTTEKQYTKNLFIEQIFPLLTPLRTGINGELPHIANLRIHVAFLLKPLIDENDMHNLFKPNEGEDLLALVQIPPVLERIVWLPTQTKEKRFTLLDDIIMLFGTHLFSGYSVEQTLVFKAVCDAAFSVDEEQDEKFIEAMEEVLLARQKSVPIRLTCTSSGNDIAKILIQKTGLMEQDVYSTDTRFIDLKTLNIVEKIEGFSHLRYPAWRNFYPSAPEKNEPMWDILKQKDILLHVPYESYEPVLQFVNDAAEDPDVLAIKMTLYRTSRNSPLV
ncbi:MAG: polyphosphate kinase 1, partial [Spirochaetales bacterium]